MVTFNKIGLGFVKLLFALVFYFLTLSLRLILSGVFLITLIAKCFFKIISRIMIKLLTLLSIIIIIASIVTLTQTPMSAIIGLVFAGFLIGVTIFLSLSDPLLEAFTYILEDASSALKTSSRDKFSDFIDFCKTKKIEPSNILDANTTKLDTPQICLNNNNA